MSFKTEMRLARREGSRIRSAAIRRQMGCTALSCQSHSISPSSHPTLLCSNKWVVTCVLCLDVLLVSSSAGEGLVAGNAVQGGEPGGAVILSCKDVRVVGQGGGGYDCDTITPTTAAKRRTESRLQSKTAPGHLDRKKKKTVWKETAVGGAQQGQDLLTLPLDEHQRLTPVSPLPPKS